MNTDFQELFNKSIKNLRLERGFSQEKFSEYCNLSADNYRSLEYNRHAPTCSTLNAVCKAFNLSPLQLLKYGIDSIENEELYLNALKGLNENQLNLVLDFIQLLKNRNY